MLSFFDRHLPHDSAALLKAMLLGENQYLSDRLAVMMIGDNVTGASGGEYPVCAIEFGDRRLLSRYVWRWNFFMRWKFRSQWVLMGY